MNKSIDRAKILEYIDMDPTKEFVSKLIDVFRSEMEKAYPTFKDNLEKNNLSDVSKLAHRLRSTCLNLGATQLSEMFRKLEYQENLNLNQIAALIEAVKHEVVEVNKELDSYINPT